jgi:hypothetical protein
MLAIGNTCKVQAIAFWTSIGLVVSSWAKLASAFGSWVRLASTFGSWVGLTRQTTSTCWFHLTYVPLLWHVHI